MWNRLKCAELRCVKCSQEWNTLLSKISPTIASACVWCGGYSASDSKDVGSHEKRFQLKIFFAASTSTHPCLKTSEYPPSLEQIYFTITPVTVPWLLISNCGCSVHFLSVQPFLEKIFPSVSAHSFLPSRKINKWNKRFTTITVIILHSSHSCWLSIPWKQTFEFHLHSIRRLPVELLVSIYICTILWSCPLVNLTKKPFI